MHSHAQRGTAPLQAAGERNPGRAPGNAAIADNRPSTLAQLVLNEMTAKSAQAVRQHALADRINASHGRNPHAVAPTVSGGNDASGTRRPDTQSQAEQAGKTPAGGDTIQRKVGFEVEVQIDLEKGRRVDPNDERAALVDAQRGYRPAAGNITKGQSIVSQDGWKLTPDGGGGNWYVEFITDAVDETADAARITAIMQSLSNYVTNTFGPMGPGQYINLPSNFVAGFDARRPGRNLDGNIHITAGVRPEKIFAMLQELQNWDDANGLTPIDENARDNLGTATAAAEQAGDDPKYRGLVALLGNYISGQQRYARMVPQGVVDIIHAGRDDSNEMRRLHNSFDRNDVRRLMRDGEIRDGEALALIRQYFPNPQDAYAMVRQIIASVAPTAAKLNVPILSRTGLGALRNKVTIPPDQYAAFRGHVLVAGGLGAGDGGTPLFPIGLNAPGDSERTIERNPDITIAAWLNGILQGENKSFSDKTFGFENVGPATGTTFCFFSTYEKGAVMEIRALDAPLAPALWAPFGTAVGTAFRALNAADG